MSRKPATIGARAHSVFARPGVEPVCWVLAIVFLALYCAARSHGEIERRDALALFIHSSLR